MLHRWNRIMLVFVGALLVEVTATGQPNAECPGFKNTLNFSEGNANFFWSARVGDRTYTPGNESDTTTGYHIMSTCVNNPDIIGHENITSSIYNSGYDANIENCGHTFFDANDLRFQIITPENDGLDQFTVGPGSTGIPRIPPGYLTSIRLGDMRSNGQAIALGGTGGSIGNNKGAEALFYTMKVNSQNSLLFINFAVVARRYSHTAYDAGEFLIRVVAQNDDGSWPNQPINDSLWYKVSAPTFDNNQMPPGWFSGYGVTGTCSYAYKPWTKVAINLSRYIYRKVRIEMYTSDCIYNFDPIYAYISGDYQSMSINASGCVDVNSDVIDTLRAPEDLLSYQWYVTTQGYETSLYNTDHMDTVHFRQVSGVPNNTSIYMPVVDDFIISEGPNDGDTVGKQTFLCVMTSALDPNKPVESKVYTNVTNNKPFMRFRVENDCDLGVQLYDQSYVYGNNIICTDSSRWIIYNDQYGTTPMDTLWGSNVSYRFPAEGSYLVSLRDLPFGSSCGNIISKVVRASIVHTPRMVIDDDTVCEGELARVWCDSNCHLNKQWQIGDITINERDTVIWTPRVGTTPIKLIISDNGECPDSVTGSVRCYGNVDVSAGTSTPQICKGDSVVLSVEGIDEPYWTSIPYDSTLDNCQGQNSVVVHPQVSTTYSVVPSQEVPCIQNISGITIDVRPYPTPKIEANPNFVDITNPTVSLTDRSDNGGDAMWTFSDGGQASGSHIIHIFNVEGLDSVGVTLNVCNSFQCCADTSIKLPVKSTEIWFPNAFTPNADNNNTFGVATVANILYYEIYIYNRQGLLTFHSTDHKQVWDGRNSSGAECPQDAYVYYCRYTLDSAPNNILQSYGTVTLIR